MSSNKFDIALLTEGKYVNPSETDWYMDQVLKEDGLVKSELERLGYSVLIVNWADKTVDWSQFKACVFRSIWDYFHRFNEFSQWLQEVKTKTKFINTIEQIIWNVDKHYLSDLMKKQIPIVETNFIEAGETRNLRKLIELSGWKKVVLKPCVSGGGRHTYLLNEHTIDAHEEIFSELIESESMMIQPFIESIREKGEVSHIVIGGKYAHSILKLAKEGDYRVQDDFGGSVHEYIASQDEIDFAEKAAKACEPTPSYARIDVVWGNNSELLIGEVELIEPELWFRNYPKSAELLALEIQNQITIQA